MESYSTLSDLERNSVRSKYEEQYPWLGLIVIKTFIVNLRNLTKNKLFICREYHIQPSEIDRMQFWEYEWYTDEIKEISKDQEKQQKQQEKEHEAMKNSMNVNGMMQNAQRSMPQISAPKMPTVNMPKF